MADQWQQQLFGKVQNTSARAVKAKATSQATQQKKDAAYDAGMNQLTANYAKQNNLPYTSNLKDALTTYFKQQQETTPIYKALQQRTQTKQVAQHNASNSFTSNPNNQDRINEYNTKMKEVGMTPSSDITQNDVNSFLGNDKTGDSGMYNRLKNTIPQQVNKGATQKSSPSFWQQIGNGISSALNAIGFSNEKPDPNRDNVTSTINVMKNAKITPMGLINMPTKEDGTLDKQQIKNEVHHSNNVGLNALNTVGMNVPSLAQQGIAHLSNKYLGTNFNDKAPGYVQDIAARKEGEQLGNTMNAELMMLGLGEGVAAKGVTGLGKSLISKQGLKAAGIAGVIGAGAGIANNLYQTLQLGNKLSLQDQLKNIGTNAGIGLVAGKLFAGGHELPVNEPPVNTPGPSGGLPLHENLQQILNNVRNDSRQIVNNPERSIQATLQSKFAPPEQIAPMPMNRPPLAPLNQPETPLAPLQHENPAVTPLNQQSTVQQAPFDYAKEKAALDEIYNADKADYAYNHQAEIQAITEQRMKDQQKYSQQMDEWNLMKQQSDQYKALKQLIPDRLKIPVNNWNDYAVNLPKSLVAAKGANKGQDIYRIANELGFQTPDDLVNHVNGLHDAHKTVQAGINKFVDKSLNVDPSTVLDELHGQTQSAQNLQQSYKDLEAINQQNIKNTPLQQAVDNAKMSDNPHEALPKVFDELQNKIADIENNHKHDEDLQSLKEEMKSALGLKLNLQLFGKNHDGTQLELLPEQKKTSQEILARIEELNKRADNLMKTRKTAQEIKNMSPADRIDYQIGRHQANIEHLGSSIDEIQSLIDNSEHGHKVNANLAEELNKKKGKLIDAQNALATAKEAKDSLPNLINHKDIWPIVNALVKPMKHFEKVFGANSSIYQALFKGMQYARQLHSNLHIQDHATIKNVRDLIGKKKEDSALLQDFGENQLTNKHGVDTTGMTKEQIKAANLTLLKQQKPDTWGNFVQANDIARKFYDDKLDAYNKVMQETYPYDSSKIIQKRDDYFHHFNEMGDGLASIINRIKHENLSKIPPSLEGVSARTRPLSQWVGQRLARMNGAYTSDAIGGMAKTAQDLNKAIAWTPQVGRLRNYHKVLSMATDKSQNINNIIRVMDKYANKLTNKSGDMDRWVGDNVLGRMGMGILSDANNIIKNNTIGYSLRTVLAQTLNAPYGFAVAKTENIIKGLPATMDYLIHGKGYAAESPFLKERIGTPHFDEFKRSVISKIVRGGHVLPEMVDRTCTTMYWNGIFHDQLAPYKQLIKENGGVIPKDIKEKVINETDKLTSEVMGGRGVGDRSAAQESKIYNTLDPFQLEPQSQWLVLGRMFDGMKNGIKNKDFRQIGKSGRQFAEWGAYSYLVGMAFKYMTGSDATLNPADDVQRGLHDGNGVIGKTEAIGKNLAGDVITSGGVPFAQTLGNLFLGSKNSKAIFGKDDPFRYSSAGALVSKPIQEMISGNSVVPKDWNFIGSGLMKHLPMSVLMPTGESVLARAEKGFNAVNEGGVYSDKNPSQMLYPVSNDLPTRLKAMTMGVGATNDGQAFFSHNRSPLSPGETKTVLEKGSQQDQKQAYDKIMAKRDLPKHHKTSTAQKQQQLADFINKLKHK